MVGPKISRRNLVVGAAATAALSTLPARAGTETPETPDTLGALAAAKGIVFGSVIDYPDKRVLGNPAVADLFATQCAQFVTGPQLLFQHHKRFQDFPFTFHDGDKVLRFAKDHGIPLAGHPLIWHSFVPNWLERAIEKDGAQAIIEAHVTELATHYKGQMSYWVVVNEPFDWQRRRKDYLIPTPFANGLGEEYIDVAFAAAAAADPGARLVLNEVGMEHDYPDAQRKRDMMVRTVKRLQSKGIPIHAVGIQGHLRPEFPFSRAKWKRFLTQIEDLGVKIMITELDVRDNHFPTDPDQRDAGVGKTMKDFLDLCLSFEACDHVITWGLVNKDSWLNWPDQTVPKGLDKYSLQLPRKDGTLHRPLLYDDVLRPTKAWDAVAQALRAAKPR